MNDLTPRKLVAELDKYIIGQHDAKRAVSIAIRNRWRRQQLDRDIKNEVMPKNIIMIGPTGVGKTEIARRLASLIKAPFIKVEASKYTEVGYHGRDVETMIRDLVDQAVSMVKKEQVEEARDKVKNQVEERILDLLLPGYDESTDEQREQMKKTRERLRVKLRQGKMEDKEVEIQIQSRSAPMIDIFSNSGVEQMGIDFQQMLEKVSPTQSSYTKMAIKDARSHLEQEESEKLVNKEDVQREAIHRVENGGIVFLDEIDKIAASQSNRTGPDVSREGVQRDLLPIIEGASVTTRYGLVKTDHILFIAAGAFHLSKPSDLIPELQGRFPIRVELSDLTKADLARIIIEPKNALTKQYMALLATEGLDLDFQGEGLERIAEIAFDVNQKSQNIGARRLHTVFEKLLEELLFEAPDIKTKKILIDVDYVNDKLADIVADEDLTHFIL